MLPYRSLISNMLFGMEALPELTAGDKTVAMLPMAHMYGMAFEFLFEILVGCHIHFLSRLPTPKIILDAFAKIKPRLIITVPLIIEKIFKKQLLPVLNKPVVKVALKLPIVGDRILKQFSDKLNRVFGDNFLEIVIGGAAFNADAEKFFKRINFRVTVGYGMTECGPLITYEDWRYIPMYSCGKAINRMEVAIDSPDPENVPGEIIVRGDNVMLGYYKNLEATASTLKDGWLHTGDLGVIDKNGYLFIKGRSKNMLLGPSGQNIYPEEIESKLNNAECISESVVIDIDGKIVALIYPDQDVIAQNSLSDDELKERLEATRAEINKQLPAYSQISQIRLHPEEFEKTPKKSIKRYLYMKK
jgi:long-chain acyl-CoA synthetase